MKTTSDLERATADESQTATAPTGAAGIVSRLRYSPIALKLGVTVAAFAATAGIVALQQTASNRAPAQDAAVKLPSVPGRPDDPSQDPLMNSGTRKAGSIEARMLEYGKLSTTKRTLRVVSADADLTGKLELAWVADGGTPVGDAHCTQTYRFNPKLAPGNRPTMMLCWRTSPQRSVYTLLVDLAVAPSAEASVAVLDRVWASGD